jgi:hypothetical protein
VLSLAGIAVIATLFWFRWTVGLYVSLLLVVLILAVGLAAYCGRERRNDSFWMFNHRLWLAAALAGLGAVLFGAGLSIIAETLHYLFGIELPTRTHVYIWKVAFGLLAPVSWLALAPTRFDETIGMEGGREFTVRAAAGLVKFVLVPLIFVYTAILYAYAAKIALDGTLPKGMLGGLVVGYLIAGSVTLLLAYPSRENGGALVRAFWRYWIWLALMPIALMFLALYVRISAYGITEDRYLIALIGVWVLALAAWQIMRPGDIDIRVVPGVLAVLLAIASFGPWGAVGVSLRSQKAELAGILEAKGLLADGKFVAQPEKNPLGTSAKPARDILRYLSGNHGLGMLEPWFEGSAANPFAPGKSEKDTTRDVFLAFSLQPPGSGRDEALTPRYFAHRANQPKIVQLAGKGYLIGPIVFKEPIPKASILPIPPDISKTPSIAPKTVALEGLGDVRLQISDRNLTVTFPNGAALDFKLLDAANALAARPPASAPRTDRDAVRIDASAPGYAGTMIIDDIDGTYRETGFILRDVQFWLVIERKE